MNRHAPKCETQTHPISNTEYLRARRPAIVVTMEVFRIRRHLEKKEQNKRKNSSACLGSMGALITARSMVFVVVATYSKLSKKLNEVRDSYSSVALHIQLPAIQFATIQDALETIAAWRLKVESETKAARKLDAALADSLKGCAVLIIVIDSKLGEASYELSVNGDQTLVLGRCAQRPHLQPGRPGQGLEVAVSQQSNGRILTSL